MAAPVISVDELLASADLSAYAQSFEEEGWDSLAALRAITEDELQVLMASVRMKRGHEVRLRKVLGMKLASERVFALTTRTRLRRLRQRRVLAPQSPLEAGVRVDGIASQAQAIGREPERRRAARGTQAIHLALVQAAKLDIDGCGGGDHLHRHRGVRPRHLAERLVGADGCGEQLVSAGRATGVHKLLERRCTRATAV